MMRLSNLVVDEIKRLLHQGKSSREIAKRVGVSIGSVLNVRKEVLETIPILKAGRPSKISERARRFLVREYDCGRITTSKQGQQLLKLVDGVDISRRAVDKILKKEGLKTYIQQKKPSLTDSQKSARLEFARSHLHWTTDDWKHVMFSDEAGFCRIEPFGKKYFRMRPESKRLKPNPSQKTKQSGGGKIFIWGCMTYNGLGDACRFPQGLDSNLYVEVLKDYIVASRDYRQLDPARFIFQHDNSSIHTASIVKNYLRKSKFAVLEWPANSPDLNPIETLWAYIRRELDKYDTDPKDLDDLWERFMVAWENVPLDFIHHLYEGMPGRMQKLYRSRGASISY